MVELPYRFVPTSNKLVSPARIVAQGGHNDKITAIACSPCARFFASADRAGCVKIWAIETLDVLGSYLIDFICTEITWENLDDVVCSGEGHQKRIGFMPDDDPIQIPELSYIDPSRVIRLIGTPEFTCAENSFTVTYNEKSYTYDLPGLIHVDMDPCERYIVAVSAKTLLVVSAFENDEIIRHDFTDERVQWLSFKISAKGDEFTAISNDGTIWIGDPVKKSFSAIFKGKCEVSAYDFAGDKLVIFGNTSGNMTIYHIPQRMLLLRTPRLPKRFVAVYPSPENIGFMALRSESASAVFGYSKEILSAAPLPAAYQASCPGSAFAEVIVACTDNSIYRLNLNDNTISRVCRIPDTDRVCGLSCSGQNLLIYLGAGKYCYHDGNKLTALPDLQVLTPISMAVSEDGQNIAIADISGICCFDIQNRHSQHIDLSGIAQVSWGKDKTAQTLFVFKSDLSIQTLDIQTGAIQNLNRLAIDCGHIISVAPAAKSFLFVLLETEHGQKAILKVGLNSGKSSIVLRIFTLGTQIWAAATDEQTIHIRRDASCLRIISGLKAYNIDDWSRSEPFM